MKNTLFLGNGLFRLKTECEKRIGRAGRDKSWGDLLSEIALGGRESFECDIPCKAQFSGDCND